MIQIQPFVHEHQTTSEAGLEKSPRSRRGYSKTEFAFFPRLDLNHPPATAGGIRDGGSQRGLISDLRQISSVR